MHKPNPDARYPIGSFCQPTQITEQMVQEWIQTISLFPERLRTEVVPLSEKELQKTYRPNGWTIAQVVHHCADSHMNSFIRFKLALTEETPIIKPYLEDRWAELVDGKDFPIHSSLNILVGVHARWTALLHAMTKQDLEKDFLHPETNERIVVKTNIGI